MILHLPKVLLSAVIAATACYQQVQGAVEGTVETYTVTGNADSAIIEYTAEDTITFNKENGHLYMTPAGQPKEVTIAAKTVITKLKLTDGSGNTTYHFTNEVSGAGEFSFTATSTCKQQTYKFTGDMSDYSGAMKLVKDDRESAFVFEGNKSGTGTIEVTGTNRVDVIGATMQNSSITASSLNVSGTSSFAGTVTANTMNVSGTSTFGDNVTADTLTVAGENTTLTIAEGKTLTIDSLVATSGTLVFESGAELVYNGRFNAAGELVDNKVYGFKKDKTVDIFEGDFGMEEARLVIVDGNTYTVDAGGVIRDYDNYYYISGDVNASVVNADLLTSGSHAGFELNGGKLTMNEDFTITGSSMLTGTTVEGAGKLIVSDGSTLQVNSTGELLKSNMHIMSGGTMTFLGTGADAINWGQTGRTIYVDGIMDVGTTRQTVGHWSFELKGGTIKGAGQSTHSNTGLDFHANSTITAKAAEGASATNPTVSTISTKIRNNSTLTFSVEDNAVLELTGGYIYNGDNAKNIATIGNNASLIIRQRETVNHKFATVTLNGGSLLTQATNAAYSTTIDSLTVNAAGGTIGTTHDTSYGNDSWQSSITITSIAGTGDLVLTSTSNTSNATTFKIAGGTGYSGTVKVQNNTDTDGRKTHLEVSDTALAGAVVEMGGGKDANGVETKLILGTEAVSVKGIKDAATRKSSGDIAKASTVTNNSTLTINTAGESYSTKSAVGAGIDLVKEGAGTQSFGGDYAGNATVKGGSLSFTKTGGSVTMDNLTLSGGSLDVSGSLTLNALSVDFSKYSTDTLTHTLVRSSDLTLGEGVDLSQLTFSKGDYTGSVAKVGESLVLSYVLAGDTDPITSTVTGVSSFADGVLTLNVTVGEEGTGKFASAGDFVLVNILTEDIMEGITTAVGSAKFFEIVLTDGTTEIKGGDNYNVGFLSENGCYYGEQVQLGDGNVAWQYSVEQIPEPTTATLSLLALMGLAARRRRK